MDSAVQLEFGSTNPANNTVVLISDIGDTVNQLICTTELEPCCGAFGNRHAEWYYPNRTTLRNMGSGDDLYRTRRDADQSSSVLGGVLLHRRNGATSPTGIYHCIIRDANSMDQTLYVGLYTSGTNGMAHNEDCGILFLIAVFLQLLSWIQ